MNAGEIIAVLEKAFPPDMAMAWDNPGIQVGRRERDVSKVYIALDATNRALEEAAGWGAELVVTHHPLLMSGIKSVSADTLQGRKALFLAERGMTHFAMHTNYDVCRMADLAGERLGLEQQEVLEVTGSFPDGEAAGIGKVGMLSAPVTVEECCDIVKKAFSVPTVKVFGRMDQLVQRVAVSPGSGKSMIPAALACRAEVLITGDIGHHEGLDSVDEGLVILDAGHYGTEHMFVHQVAGLLQEKFPGLQIREEAECHPFQVR